MKVMTLQKISSNISHIKQEQQKQLRRIVMRQKKQNLFNPNSRFYHTCSQVQRPLCDCQLNKYASFGDKPYQINSLVIEVFRGPA